MFLLFYLAYFTKYIALLISQLIHCQRYIFYLPLALSFCYQIHPVTRSDRKSNNTWAACMRKCKLLLLTGFITDDSLDNVSFRDLRLPTITRSSDNAFDVFFCCMQLEHAPSNQNMIPFLLMLQARLLFTYKHSLVFLH